VQSETLQHKHRSASTALTIQGCLLPGKIKKKKHIGNAAEKKKEKAGYA